MEVNLRHGGIEWTWQRLRGSLCLLQQSTGKTHTHRKKLINPASLLNHTPTSSHTSWLTHGDSHWNWISLILLVFFLEPAQKVFPSDQILFDVSLADPDPSLYLHCVCAELVHLDFMSFIWPLTLTSEGHSSSAWKSVEANLLTVLTVFGLDQKKEASLCCDVERKPIIINNDSDNPPSDHHTTL